MILIVDGNNIAYRSFHTPQGMLCTKAGEPTGVMLGVLHSLKVYLDKFQNASKVIVCWDFGKAKWRKEMYPEYKANRSYGDNPEEKARFDGLFQQINQLDEFLPSLGVQSVKLKEQEADDLIYAVCQMYKNEPKMVITSDKDMLQLIDRTTTVYTPYKDKVISLLNFYEETGVTPEAYMGYRALVGDSSDNIPGVPGIGEKTAKGLMDKYGHIDNILNPTAENKALLMKSARTSKIFKPENLAIVGRNHRIMNFKYVNYDDIKDEIIANISDKSVVDSKAVKDFLVRWQFVSILTNYMPFILTFRSISEEI